MKLVPYQTEEIKSQIHINYIYRRLTQKHHKLTPNTMYIHTQIVGFKKYNVESTQSSFEENIDIEG